MNREPLGFLICIFVVVTPCPLFLGDLVAAATLTLVAPPWALPVGPFHPSPSPSIYHQRPCWGQRAALSCPRPTAHPEGPALTPPSSLTLTQLVHPVQGADGLSEPEGISLKRVAVVEDFFDIIYSMHVESSAEPGKAPKHAGQKKTYRAVRSLPCPCSAPGLGRRPWAPHMLGGGRGGNWGVMKGLWGPRGAQGKGMAVGDGSQGRGRVLWSEHKGEAG